MQPPFAFKNNELRATPRITFGLPTHQTNLQLLRNLFMSNFLSPVELQILRQSLENKEGYVEHMYLDSVGRVTVGVGHLISTETSAINLPFYRTDGTLAAPDKIRVEYRKIASLSFGPATPASSFQPKTTLKLKQSDIHSMRDQHITQFEKELVIIYPDFHTYPSNVKLALFDMIFNLGMTTLRNTFTKFNASIKAKQWKDAAKNSARYAGGRPLKSRNDYVKQLLESAK